MNFCCKVSIVITVMVIGGFIILGLGLGVEGNRQSEAPFLAWLGAGLGLICLGIVVMLVALFAWIFKELASAGVIKCCDCCRRDEEGSAYFHDTRHGGGPWTEAMRFVPQGQEAFTHEKLSAYLHEECEAQGESDLMKVFDKLQYRWHLPRDIYNIFDGAAISRTLYNPRSFRSVKLVAKSILEYATMESGWLQISSAFRADLMRIRSNHEPADYSTLANLYVLLKSKSLNTDGMDASPRSNIAPCDIPNVPAQGLPASAPPSERQNTTPGRSKPQQDIPSVPPPSYDEVLMKDAGEVYI